jgi:hypothetical protein
MSNLTEQQREALEKLRTPFEAHHISKLPKPTKAQTDAVRADYKNGMRCAVCGTWHHKDVVHLDYVGHAAITHRLLDVDPTWSWEPVAFDGNGLPLVDKDGGMWIKLTICGMTRLGYGDAEGKTGPSATKERIGDALRNAGMRFGMALDLWHKGVLEMEPERFEPNNADKWIMRAESAADLATLEKVWTEGVAELVEKDDRSAYNEFKAMVQLRKKEFVPIAQEAQK